MGDYCKSCSIDLWGKDHKELAGISTKADTDKGMFAPEICENCGHILVNHLGECVTLECDATDLGSKYYVKGHHSQEIRRMAFSVGPALTLGKSLPRSGLKTVSPGRSALMRLAVSLLYVPFAVTTGLLVFTVGYLAIAAWQVIDVTRWMFRWMFRWRPWKRGQR